MVNRAGLGGGLGVSSSWNSCKGGNVSFSGKANRFNTPTYVTEFACDISKALKAPVTILIHKTAKGNFFSVNTPKVKDLRAIKKVIDDHPIGGKIVEQGSSLLIITKAEYYGI